MNRILDVYLYDIKAGQLKQKQSGGLSFSYEQSYVLEGKPLLSLSLPLSLAPYEGDVVKAFFSGILPDDLNRMRLAKYLGISEKNSFALLKVIGGECAGAVSLFPQGKTPQSESNGEDEILDEKKLGTILELLKKRPLLAGDYDLRLSLAGAQDKLAVALSYDRKIILVRGARPTTHILKPAISTVEDSVQNEFFCMRLAKDVGIETPNVSMGWVKEAPYFLVERYDRNQDHNGLIQRMHQEDFCQALGVMPEMKYEREGGPSAQQCQQLIQKASFKPAVDQLHFLNRLMFNYFIGNSDAHGKNFSFLYQHEIRWS